VNQCCASVLLVFNAVSVCTLFALAVLPMATDGEQLGVPNTNPGSNKRSASAAFARPPLQVGAPAEDEAHERWKKDPAFPRWLSEQRACGFNIMRSRMLLNVLDAKRQTYFNATASAGTAAPRGQAGVGRVLGGRASPHGSARGAGPSASAVAALPENGLDVGAGGGQKSSVLQHTTLSVLLEVRRRFAARQLQAGLRPAGGPDAKSTAEAEACTQPSPGTGTENEGGKRSNVSPLRELNAAKRRRAEEAAAADLSSVSRAMGVGVAAIADAKGEQEWECIVCGEALRDRVLGRVDCNRTHVFCFECIHKWGSSIENSCPLCKQSFRRIDKLVLAPKVTPLALFIPSLCLLVCLCLSLSLSLPLPLSLYPSLLLCPYVPISTAILWQRERESHDPKDDTGSVGRAAPVDCW